MGNSSASPTRDAQPINRGHFSFKYVIGKGGFGRVWRVKMKKTKQILAMKEMSKMRVASKHSVNAVMRECRLLSMLRHPFIVNMKFAFQTRENLYLAMDMMPGGDLRYHLGLRKQFNETQSQFFVACILTALEYLHLSQVVHRDIKPENLVLDHKGYLRVTDFGISGFTFQDNSGNSSGTPGYMAPEVVCKLKHGPPADYFALGVIAYELMKNTRPYRGRDKMEIRDQMLSRQVQLKRSDIPAGWSLESADFINKLLKRKPSDRLGAGGAQELKNHAWLRDFPWQKLFEKSLKAPYIPTVGENFDQRNRVNWQDDDFDSLAVNSSLRSMFSGYYFNEAQQDLSPMHELHLV
jgi:serine/threonine protein kinase